MIGVKTGIYNQAAGSGLLLDLHPANTAYSLRKLRNDYAGAAIQVRRSSDNVLSTIGFDGDDLDLSALTSFVGASDGFVRVFYDQQGSNDATQTVNANQLQLVSGGVVNLINGKPALITNNFKYFNYPLDITDRWYCFSTIKAISTEIACLFGSDSTLDYFALSDSGSTSTTLNNNLTVNSLYRDGSVYSLPANRGDLYTDLASQSLLYSDLSLSFEGATGRLGYASLAATSYSMQEFVFYDVDPVSNINDINNNINNYYSIY